MRVRGDGAEDARAVFVELFPEGFEEAERPDGLELAAYTGSHGEEALRRAFDAVDRAPVEPGWEDRWREFHRPVSIGRLWVGPPWEPVPAGAAAVVIDPGRAFGTGAHPTTRLCLELLQELETGSVLDVGCGSGVLAIAAARLGFDPVVAVDVDPAAVAATRRNAGRNGVRVVAERVEDRSPLPPARIALANISLDVVRALPARLDVDAIVSSGYLAAERPQLDGYVSVERRALDGWAADVHERR